MEGGAGSDPDARADKGSSDPLEASLLACQRWLEQGDYGRVVRTLEPLVAGHPAGSAVGGQLQLLLATAWMGQGNSARAIACCHQLKRCADAQLRAQARDLLGVLEAPALERPREWSITLPELVDAEAVQGRLTGLASGRRRPAQPPLQAPPPVGPTRANLGFMLAAAALMLLTVLLAGCMEVRGELHLSAPGRVELGVTLHADGPQPTPWQHRFGAYLAGRGLRPMAPRSPTLTGVEQRWRSAPLPAGAALEAFAADLAQAARLAGLDLPRPRLELRERNVLVGVWQTLAIDLDLSPLAGVRGVDLAMDVDPVSLAAVRQADPIAARPLPGQRAVRWPLQPGALNHLELHCWRWSPLGLGALLIALALAIALALQNLRRRLVPPLPQLPA